MAILRMVTIQIVDGKEVIQKTPFKGFQALSEAVKVAREDGIRAYAQAKDYDGQWMKITVRQ